MEHEIIIENKIHRVNLDARDGKWILSGEDKKLAADIRRIGPNELSIIIDGNSYPVFIVEREDRTLIFIRGRGYETKIPGGEEIQAEERSAGADALIVKSPMPGKVIKVCVSDKEKISRNQTLLIVEAMKMENEIKAGIDGSVKKICIEAGDLVDCAKVLIELEE